MEAYLLNSLHNGKEILLVLTGHKAHITRGNMVIIVKK